MTQLDDSARTATNTDLDRRRMLHGAAVGGLALPLLAACGGEASSGARAMRTAPRTPAARRWPPPTFPWVEARS